MIGLLTVDFVVEGATEAGVAAEVEAGVENGVEAGVEERTRDRVGQTRETLTPQITWTSRLGINRFYPLTVLIEGGDVVAMSPRAGKPGASCWPFSISLEYNSVSPWYINARMSS